MVQAIREEDLSIFQVCPKRFTFSKEHGFKFGVYVQGHELQHPIHTMFKWVWTSQLRTGAKATNRALKEKWGIIAPTWCIRQQMNMEETRDFVSKTFGIVSEYWKWYETSEFIPTATGVPVTIKMGRAVYTAIIPVLVSTAAGTTVLNSTIDKDERETITDYVVRARLFAATTLVDSSTSVSLINFRFGRSLTSFTLRAKRFCTPEFKNNLTYMLNSIVREVNYPIRGCELVCPFRKICTE